MIKLIKTKVFRFTALIFFVILIGLVIFLSRLASRPDRYQLTIKNKPKILGPIYIIGKNESNYFPLSYYYPFMYLWAEMSAEGLSGKIHRNNDIISIKWPNDVSLDSILIKVNEDEWLEYKINSDFFPANHISIFKFGGAKNTY